MLLLGAGICSGIGCFGSTEDKIEEAVGRVKKEDLGNCPGELDELLHQGTFELRPAAEGETETEDE